MDIEQLPKVNQIFINWLRKNLPYVNCGFYSHRERYVGKINPWKNSIESWIEVPAYHEAFAYVFLFFLNKRNNKLYIMNLVQEKNYFQPYSEKQKWMPSTKF